VLMAARPHGCRIVVIARARTINELQQRQPPLTPDSWLARPFQPSSLFNSLLPAAPDASDSPLQPASDPSCMFSGYRVLLVEDNRVNQQVAEAFLGRRGFSVVTVDDGEEAVEASGTGAFDLILMDLHMPKVDGFEATRRIIARDNDKSPPIIAMTAAVMEEDRNRCMEAGMVDFVAKPIEIDQLLATLQRWLAPSAQRPGDKPAARLAQDQKGETTPLLDQDSALDRLGGDRALYRRLLADFISDEEGAITEIEELLALGDYEAATSRIHSLKGVAANLGAKRIATLAASAESAIRREEDEPNTCLQLADAVHETIELFKSLTAADTTGHSDSSEERLEQAVPLVTALIPYLENHELAPPDLIDQLHQLADNDPASELQPLLERLDQFDLGGALAEARVLAGLERD
jgi:two-component system sensor histidine kinase/response regulator